MIIDLPTIIRRRMKLFTRLIVVTELTQNPILNKWNIKYVHSCTGWYYNDNYKCFSILAKRKNAKLIGHEHGVNNFCKFFPDRNNLSPFYKGFSTLYFSDYYIFDNPNELSIQHMDCMAKLVDAETIIIKQVSEDSPEYECIEDFENKKIDILVATQIMAKGYHFPNLSLVATKYVKTPSKSSREACMASSS